ncbi:uncharacterized protein EV422DRAFT_82306 [Fimicolochytrium jonesii]|uniref:uncharacterized protein n=1 Tax=Fimicolochytrium jonesii TaxID=1396493 RepID=UPI0022FE40D5|nr:uncharacterized protein EV422DRAFT_82306 [Fimicolochytrium jonesii]KAI8820192.1 hypothetical protein EV422DRAFT_82306 [Fimicolochytrium jonesii]
MPVAALFQTKRPSYARHRSLYLVSFVLVVLLCLATLSFTPAHAANTRSSRAKDRVLASDIQILTLYKNKYTTGKRSRPVPQLKCTNTGIEKPLCKDPAALPDVVQCRQVGLNAAGEPQWKCEAELEDLYKFGTTDVTCEGYDYPEDPYVLVGSCGVEYTILKTQKWFERERDRGAGRGRESYRASDDSGNSWWDTLFGASHSPSSPHYDPYPERATREPKITHWLRSLLPFGLGALIPDFGLDPIAWLGLRHKFPFSLIFGSGAGYRGYNDDDCEFVDLIRTFQQDGLQPAASHLVHCLRTLYL